MSVTARLVQHHHHLSDRHVMPLPLLPPQARRAEGDTQVRSRRKEAHVPVASVHGRTHVSLPPAVPTTTINTSTTTTNVTFSERPTIISRTHQPPSLTLRDTNGLTSTSLPDLRQQINSSKAGAGSTVSQLARPKRKRSRSVKPSIPPGMGNGQSVPDDNASDTHTVVRKPVRVLRKSSTNLFKRVDSKSPLPRPATSATTIAREPDSSSLFGVIHNESEAAPSYQRPAHLSVTPSLPFAREGYTSQRTEEETGEALSASTTIQDDKEARSDDDQSSVMEQRNQMLTAPPSRSALSPLIPTPEPVPADTPHKYGLKDRMETPELQDPPGDIKAVKGSRRGSGLELFQHATSLQTASSFLNGLSVSRRRAESSAAGTSESWAHIDFSLSSRPASARPMSARPHSVGRLSSCYMDGENERRLKPFQLKKSGFAYSLPLTISQMRCYRNHEHMVMSRNRNAQVECSVCHIDDDHDHYSCSWCAIRLCSYCRGDFQERGITALKERIKLAELGLATARSS